MSRSFNGLVGVLVTVLGGGQAAAQDTGDAAPVLPTLQVTAKGYEAPAKETPQSVGVIESETIRRAQALSVGALLRGEPGLATAVDGSVGIDPVIRGLKRDQILIMIDGVRVNAMQPPARGSLASYVNTDLIERIEVVRGPGSVLYGSGAMGGVINLITRGGDFRPQPDTSGWSRVGVSSVDNGFRGAFGVTAAGPETVLSLNAAHLDVDDYETGKGDELADTATSQASFHLEGKRRLGTDHVITARLQRDRRRDVWYLASRNVNPNSPPNGSPRPPQGLNTHYTPEQTRDRYELAWEGTFDGGWAPRAQARIHRQRLERGNYDYNAPRRTDYRTSDTAFVTDGLRGQLELAPTLNQVLMVGVEAWEQRASPTSHIGLAPAYDPGDRRMNLVDDGRIRSVGAFVQEELQLGSVTVTAGARYDTVRANADDAAGVGGDLSSTDHNLSWSLGANGRVMQAFRPYASLSQGYRSASLLERYLTYTYSDGFRWISNPQLDPERNRTLEVGARGEVGRLSYTLAAYESRIDDYIGGQAVSNTRKETINLDEARIRGVEASLQYRLGNGVTTFFDGTWIEGENRDDAFDEPLYQMPPPEAALGLRREVTQGWQGRLAVRAVDEQERVADTFSSGSERETPGFATVDLAIGYRITGDGLWKTSEVTLAVRNALDKAYREHINEMTEDRLDPANGVQDLLAPGRNVALTWYLAY